MFVDVRDPTTKRLLFRYDPTRELIEIKPGVAHAPKVLIDLKEIKENVNERQEVR